MATTTDTNEPQTARASGSEIAVALDRIRSEKQPTRRGVMICGQAMAQMLMLGWRTHLLDALEILFWSVRDGDGRLLSQNSQIFPPEGSETMPGSQTL